jgi:hypothetical protein
MTAVGDEDSGLHVYPLAGAGEEATAEELAYAPIDAATGKVRSRQKISEAVVQEKASLLRGPIKMHVPLGWLRVERSKDQIPTHPKAWWCQVEPRGHSSAKAIGRIQGCRHFDRGS